MDDEAEDNEAAALSLAESAREMEKLKSRLLAQQLAMKEALVRMADYLKRQQQQKAMVPLAQPLSAAATATVGGEQQSSLTESATSAAARTCPMCEAFFRLDTSQDAFEAHVVDHFRYEESETLKGFDLVHDVHGNDFDP
jgi:hypothetical protein